MLFIIFSSAAVCTVLYYIEQYLSISYPIKTAVKIFLFTGLPLLYVKFYNEGTILHSLRIDSINIKVFKSGIFLGIIIFAGIFSAYMVLGWMIDFEGIKNELQTKLKITASSFIFVGLYITFINSLIEEFFFRGFIFLKLYQMGYRKAGGIISSVFFGLYHMAIFKTWFPLPIILLSVISLISVGFIFNYLNTRTRNFLNSWIVHIIADSAVITIGLKLFYF